MRGRAFGTCTVQNSHSQWKRGISASARPASDQFRLAGRGERETHGVLTIAVLAVLLAFYGLDTDTAFSGALTGKQAADGNEADIVDGTVNGNDVAWKASITNPMPLTLAFSGKVDGDSISGDVSIGPMGSFPFKGTRA